MIAGSNEINKIRVGERKTQTSLFIQTVGGKSVNAIVQTYKSQLFGLASSMQFHFTINPMMRLLIRAIHAVCWWVLVCTRALVCIYCRVRIGTNYLQTIGRCYRTITRLRYGVLNSLHNRVLISLHYRSLVLQSTQVCTRLLHNYRVLVCTTESEFIINYCKVTVCTTQ